MNELFQELQNTHAKLEVRHCYVSFILISSLSVNWYTLQTSAKATAHERNVSKMIDFCKSAVKLL